MKKKVSAIIVTYNRLNLLKECINAVRQQTYTLNNIIVVNNGSTDHTLDWLNSQNDIKVYNQDNSGAAGGFERGLIEATKTDSDWFWLMDDDVEATANCLENLLLYTNISECIHPVREYLDGRVVNWEQYWNFQTDSRFNLFNQSFQNGKDYCFVNVGCFEGMLLSKNLVEKIGYPDPRFFLIYDDSLYGYLASLYTNIIYTSKAKLIRKKLSENEKLTKSFIYYSTRNRHLILEYILRIYPDTNLNKLKIKYLILEIKQLIYFIVASNFSKVDKKDFIIHLVKGKIDYYKNKYGKM